MKAMLLAAGLGTRLRPHTEEIPKCMVPVGGRPVLVRNLEWLRSSGITSVVINLHHRPSIVRSGVGDGSALGMKVTYSYEASLLGTAGALRAAGRWLRGGAFLTVYADNLVNCQLDRLVDCHKSSGAVVTIALHQRSDVTSSGVAEIDSSERIVTFLEKPAAGVTESRLVNAGLMVCEPAIIDAIPRSAPSDLGRDVIPALIAAGQRVQGYVMGPGETLHWIDTPADLEAADRFVASISPR